MPLWSTGLKAEEHFCLVIVHFVKQTEDEEHREVLQEAQIPFCKTVQAIIVPFTIKVKMNL